MFGKQWTHILAPRFECKLQECYLLLHTIILFISRASRDCSFNYTFLINALTNHSNFGLSIEAVVSFRTVVDKRYALQAEQVSIPVSEKVLWTLPIRRACSRFTHGSSYNKKQEYSSKDYFGVVINIVSILSMDIPRQLHLEFGAPTWSCIATSPANIKCV